MNPTSSTRLLCACIALFASACTGSTGSSSGDDGGASSGAAAACAYVQTDVTSCFGEETSTARVVCDDEPCSAESWDPLPVVAGSDCYGYSQYSSQTDVAETCDQWQAKGGFSAPGSDDGGLANDPATCPSLDSLGNSPCDECIKSWCGSGWCGCVGGSSLDDSGIPRCVDYFGCLAGCIGDAGAASIPGCETRCGSGYSATERASADALVSCQFSHCRTSATCG